MLWPRTQRESRGCICLFSMSRRERGGPQDIELTLNEKLLLMAHEEEEESLPVCLNDPRPCGPHLLHLRLQGQRPSGEDLLCCQSFWWNLETNRCQKWGDEDIDSTYHKTRYPESRIYWLQWYSSEPGIQSLESVKFRTRYLESWICWLQCDPW